MHHAQPQQLLKAIKIMVPVQQFVPGPQAKSGNQTVDCFVNGVTSLTKVAVVLSGGDRQFDAARMKNLEFQQVGSHPSEHVLLTNSLQHFTKT